jgi:N-sulfoglucosamine sulfohydrolase
MTTSNPISRRSFCSLAPAAVLGAAAPKPRPNILFCFADDWAYPHAGVYGDPVIKTPNFDRVAKEGVLFTHAFSAAPSCTPSRAAVLTGQYPHRLREGGNLLAFLPKEFPVYSDLLEESGYAVGYCDKGWGPGTLGGRKRNPAGPKFDDFASFLKQAPAGTPFCFWHGSRDPHRGYKPGSGLASGMRIEDVKVPKMWPDTPEVRSDILDYYFAAQRFDSDLGKLLEILQQSGQAANTIVVVSGDNGWPFPHGKANLYDAGTRQPLAVRWPAAIKPGRTLDDFINLQDLAPTFLEAAGLKPPAQMTGRSFLGLVTGREKPGARDRVFLERERHANVRKGDLSYPSRAARTREFLYIRNLRPDRWPAGDPQTHFAVGPFGDCDGGPTKDYILKRRDQPEMKRYFDISFAKRPAEELYDLKKDPDNIDNVASKPEYAAALGKMRAMLTAWMKDTADPRATSDDDPWDRYVYIGPAAGQGGKKK